MLKSRIINAYLHDEAVRENVSKGYPEPLYGLTVDNLFNLLNKEGTI